MGVLEKLKSGLIGTGGGSFGNGRVESQTVITEEIPGTGMQTTVGRSPTYERGTPEYERLSPQGKVRVDGARDRFAANRKRADIISQAQGGLEAFSSVVDRRQATPEYLRVLTPQVVPREEVLRVAEGMVDAYDQLLHDPSRLVIYEHSIDFTPVSNLDPGLVRNLPIDREVRHGPKTDGWAVNVLLRQEPDTESSLCSRLVIADAVVSVTPDVTETETAHVRLSPLVMAFEGRNLLTRPLTTYLSSQAASLVTAVARISAKGPTEEFIAAGLGTRGSENECTSEADARLHRIFGETEWHVNWVYGKRDFSDARQQRAQILWATERNRAESDAAGGKFEREVNNALSTASSEQIVQQLGTDRVDRLVDLGAAIGGTWPDRVGAFAHERLTRLGSPDKKGGPRLVFPGKR
ncbi:MAG: hypothetical protein WC841_04810 [Candidatus Shapirobacteria bacterium]|jgi:hypothetical protein